MAQSRGHMPTLQGPWPLTAPPTMLGALGSMRTASALRREWRMTIWCDISTRAMSGHTGVGCLRRVLLHSRARGRGHWNHLADQLAGRCGAGCP